MLQTSNRAQKVDLEKAAIKWLLQCDAFADYRLIIMQDKPDAIIENNSGEKLGVEICHPFYDDQDAKLLLGRESGGMSGLQSSTGVIQRINKEIGKKITKFSSYTTEYPIILLFRLPAESPLSADFINLPDHKLDIPQNKYAGIYILLDDGINGKRSWTTLYKAYPG